MRRRGMRRRGTTLVELTLGMVMVVVLTFATTSLYSYSTRRVAAEGANSAVQIQANQCATEIAKMVAQAKVCSVVAKGNAQALVCEMPATGTDEDMDGILDHFVPDGSSRGKEVFNTGFYVWFYMSDDTGEWGHRGAKLWRAVVYSANPPLAGDVDQKWNTYYGSGYRWNLIDRVDFTCDPLKQLTNYTITASSLNRADRSLKSDPNGEGATLTLSWSVYWRNFRNLVVDGSFEVPDLAGAGSEQVTTDALPGGWESSSPGPYEVQSSGVGAPSYYGKQHLELDADTPGSIKQTLATEAGKRYALSFAYTPRPGCADNRIEVRWNGAVIASLDGKGVLNPKGAWSLKTYSVTATGPTADLEFIDRSKAGDKMGGLIDNVVVIPK